MSARKLGSVVKTIALNERGLYIVLTVGEVRAAQPVGILLGADAVIREGRNIPRVAARRTGLDSNRADLGASERAPAEELPADDATATVN